MPHREQGKWMPGVQERSRQTGGGGGGGEEQAGCSGRQAYAVCRLGKPCSTHRTQLCPYPSHLAGKGRQVVDVHVSLLVAAPRRKVEVARHLPERGGDNGGTAGVVVSPRPHGLLRAGGGPQDARGTTPAEAPSSVRRLPGRGPPAHAALRAGPGHMQGSASWWCPCPSSTSMQTYLHRPPTPRPKRPPTLLIFSSPHMWQPSPFCPWISSLYLQPGRQGGRHEGRGPGGQSEGQSRSGPRRPGTTRRCTAGNTLVPRLCHRSSAREASICAGGKPLHCP